MAYRQSEKRALLMDVSVANWWNEEEYAVDINEEDYLISIESVDHSITTRARYEKRCASSDINNKITHVFRKLRKPVSLVVPLMHPMAPVAWHYALQLASGCSPARTLDV